MSNRWNVFYISKIYSVRNWPNNLTNFFVLMNRRPYSIFGCRAAVNSALCSQIYIWHQLKANIFSVSIAYISSKWTFLHLCSWKNNNQQPSTLHIPKTLESSGSERHELAIDAVMWVTGVVFETRILKIELNYFFVNTHIKNYTVMFDGTLSWQQFKFFEIFTFCIT